MGLLWRGVPLLLYLYGHKFFTDGTFIDKLIRVLIAITFEAAYMAEVVRGGFCFKGQHEAARSWEILENEPINHITSGLKLVIWYC